jgi:hypothetical protein
VKAALVLALLLTVEASAQVSDWRPAEAKDVVNLGGWEFRKDRADLALFAFGDFDGDGKQDRAELSVNDDARKFGLFVRLANGESVLLVEHPLNDLPSMGICMMPRSSYPTFCGRKNASRRARGKSDSPCEVPAIDMKADGINLFTYEKSGRTFYWKDDAFVSEWMSD